MESYSDRAERGDHNSAAPPFFGFRGAVCFPSVGAGHSRPGTIYSAANVFGLQVGLRVTLGGARGV